MVLAATGSFFNALGWLLCSEACINGIAGPAQALIELQCIWQLMLEVIIHGHVPTALQFLGMLIAMAGSLIMTLDLTTILKRKTRTTTDTDFIKQNK